MLVPLTYICVILIWSTTPLTIQWSSEGTGYLFGVSSRMIIGMVICTLIMLLMKQRLLLHKQAMTVYVAVSLATFGAMLSVYWGARFIPSGLISVIFGLTPLLTGIFAALWLQERNLSVGKISGALIGIAGLFVIFQNQIHLDNQDAPYGIAAVFFAVILHSVSTVWAKKLSTDLPAIVTTTGGLALTVPAFLLAWLLFDGVIPNQIPIRTGISILYLGVFGSAIGFLLYFYTLKHIDATKMALIPLVTPVTALILGKIFNQEIIDAATIVGTACILTGLAFFQFSDYLAKRKLVPQGMKVPRQI